MDGINYLLNKKVEDYKFEEKDFVAEGEITVTITLNEYRALVASHATRSEAIKQAESDKYNREDLIKKLTTEVAALKTELYETKKALEAYREKEDEEE